ncbi:hypothetical protein HN51_060010 [Arachis hypogaea]|uniref:ZF-HD dimerization-type domain-containing protein n=2 Tax=Arachis hypogaea TaxID=3818 RepID=A0A444X850_ARAHY|nr:zinc-finger homeodomain protein 10 [Arachis hypogaea]QHN83555.1 Zinc-finger homeodomain protein [Arachis hypogaea]RYQ85868.1 hypothetical protein Ahy_B10g105497 isoform B [Arachis hypogaea]
MEIITNNATTTITNPPKSPEPESETPTRIQPTNTKPVSFSNGVLKRHHPPQHYHHQLASPTAVTAAVAVTYKECLKNHAASLGGHALDGCGEFMPAPTATAGDPTSIKCAACGCHRNFHRRDPDEPPPPPPLSPVIEYQPLHRHHPPPPAPPPPPFHHHHHRSPNSASPPPISSSYYPSAPHMLLALSSGGGLSVPPENTALPASNHHHHHHLSSRKRFRTKFTQEQKEKMHVFAERVGWKIQKRDEDLIQEFCHEVGVDRGVLKVWMHNNKNTFGKREREQGNTKNVLEGPGINGADDDNNNNNKSNGLNGGMMMMMNGGDGSGHDDDGSADANGAGTNGSSSSS